MDNKAFNKLSYGVFMLSTKFSDKKNGCIINTCIQVANNPQRIAVSVINSNYTCELIKKSRVFAVSVLDEKCTFETIKYWGFQSGHNVDKFSGISLPSDINDIPYMNWHTCAFISGKVVEEYNLGTHTLFIAEVVDAKKINDNQPLTYADYHSRLKPKPAEIQKEKKIIGWKCKICNYVYEGSKLPEEFLCPLCGHGAEDFEPIYE